MNSRKQAIPDVSADVLPAGQNHDGIGGKKAHHRFGDPLHHDADAQPESGCNKDGIAQGKRGTLVLSGTDILCPQCRHSGKHGRRYQEQETDDLFHNAHRCGIAQTAPVGNNGNHDESNLDKTVLEGHRQTDFQDLAQNRAPELQIFFAQVDAGLAFENDRQRNHHTDCLREGSPQCGTGRSQPHGTDKQIIQGYVGRTRHGNEIHGAFGIPQSAENRTDDVVCSDTGDSDKADGQISGGSGDGFFRGRHNGNNGAYQQEQHSHQGNGYHHKQGNGVADDGGNAFVLPGADGPADADSGTHGQPHDHDGDHVHDLAAYRNRRSAGRSLELADDEQIGHPVQRLQKIGQKIRQRKVQYIVQYAARGQIFLHVLCSLVPRKANTNGLVSGGTCG